MKTYKFLLALAVTLSLVSFTGFATPSLAFQVQTELVLTKAPRDTQIFAFIQETKSISSKQLCSFSRFDFNCFINHFNSYTLTNFNILALNFNEFKRALECIHFNQEPTSKQIPIHKRFLG